MFDHGWVPFRRQNLIQNGPQGSPNRALRLPTAPLRRPRRTGMTLESPRLDFGSSRAPFWLHFGSHFELVFGVFWELKSMTFFDCFLMGFGAHLEAIWGPKMHQFGARGGTGGEKATLQKPLFYLRKTMVFEVRRPRGRAQIEKKRVQKPIQKTGLEILRFFAILGPKMEPKWDPNRIQNLQKNRCENRAPRRFNGKVHGGPRRSPGMGRRQWRRPGAEGEGGR